MMTREELKQAAATLILDRVDWSIDWQAVAGTQVVVCFSEYVDRFLEADRDQFEVIDAELEKVVDVVNPATGRASTVFDHASKLDVLAVDRYHGRTVVIEHKSTSDSLEPDSFYWLRLAIDSQVSKYILTAKQAGFDDCSACVYDVVSKPSTSTIAVPKADVRRIAETGQYCGFYVSKSTREVVSERYESEKGKRGGFQGKLHESEILELYGLRLRKWLNDRDAFGRKLIVRSDDDLLEYARELWSMAADIRKARREGFNPRNAVACWSFSRPCEYFRLCSGQAEVDGVEFYHSPDSVHVELDSDFPDRGLNVLTNSRLSCFQQCRRKHELRYENGVREVRASTGGALWWGTLYHEVLEIYWRSLRKVEA